MVTAPNEPYLLESTPRVIPSHTDSGLGHLTCCGQWDISKCDKSRGLISSVCWGLSSWNSETTRQREAEGQEAVKKGQGREGKREQMDRLTMGWPPGAHHPD